jgi:nicotinamide-nucleotide adenylyltransferase
MSPATLDLQALQSLRTEFSKSLKDFATSSSAFRILHTIPPTSAPSHGKPIPTRTLYVLDSSFNPPSKAHSSLVKTALRSKPSKSEKKDQSQGESPRVLFLLATVNADKKPKPADFEDRIVMMTLAAQDLRSCFSSERPSASPSISASASASVSEASDKSDPPAGRVEAPIIDIGITKLPYFVDKASAITASNVYENPDREDDVVEQIHLTGFDTLLRIFTPKYYPKHDPPLSALEPFLMHHRVRATIRVDPDSPSENLKDAQKTEVGSSTGAGAAPKTPDYTTPEGQMKYLEDIREGSLEKEGMKREWADRVDLVVDEGGEAEGVSSTKVRDAVREGNWDQVGELVGPGVGVWIKERGLYLEGDTDGSREQS